RAYPHLLPGARVDIKDRRMTGKPRQRRAWGQAGNLRRCRSQFLPVQRRLLARLKDVRLARRWIEILSATFGWRRGCESYLQRNPSSERPFYRISPLDVATLRVRVGTRTAASEPRRCRARR